MRPCRRRAGPQPELVLAIEVVQKDRTERTSLFMLKAIVRSFLNHLRELRDTFPIRNVPR